MRVASAEDTQKIRRKAADAILAYDLSTGNPVGQIVDLSVRGMKLFGEIPMMAHRIYFFRIPLLNKIDKQTEVFVDAECRWCRQNEDTGWYNSGYSLRYPSPKDAEIVQKLIRTWMVVHLSKMNTHNRGPAKKGLLHQIGAILQTDLSLHR